MRRAVYVAHPLNAPTRAGIEANLSRGARWCAWLATYFSIAPLAPWIYLAGIWLETPENRARGLEIDFATIDRCDELWLVGPRVSEGMLLEARHAFALGKRVRNLTRVDLEELSSSEGRARLSVAFEAPWVPPAAA
jgi:hypothetical protein